MLDKEKRDLIIVPFDFTEEAENALKHASILANAGNDEIRLLHIINRETKSKLKKEGVGEEAIDERLTAIALRNEQENMVKTTWHAEEGSIFNSIGDYMTDAGAVIAVMGTHGVRGVQHLVGAFALKVVTSSPVPVIIVQRKEVQKNGYKRIVVPIDDNTYGKNKVIHAIAVAKYFGSEIILFAASSGDEYMQKHINQNVIQAETFLQKNGIAYRLEREEAREGSFARQLIRLASADNADLIVISTKQDTVALQNLILGNNEVEIINNDAQIAVMAVNPVQDTSYMGNVLFM